MEWVSIKERVRMEWSQLMLGRTLGAEVAEGRQRNSQNQGPEVRRRLEKKAEY